jgi:hypothetical protein
MAIFISYVCLPEDDTMILKCKLAYSLDISTDGWVNINQFITGKLHFASAESRYGWFAQL